LPHSEPDVLIKRLDRALVRTGLAIAPPGGYAAFVHPRSGLPGSVRGDGGFGSTGGHDAERTELVS